MCSYACSTLICSLICSPKGKIACANVLSDLYAMGVSECDNMLMLLGISENFTNTQRQVVAPMMIQGFIGGYVIYSLLSHCVLSCNHPEMSALFHV